MDATCLKRVVTLRLAVGQLGERAQPNWWPTTWYAEYSNLFLAPVFPRTMEQAMLVGMTSAACAVHDKALGVGNVYHLFRLPEAWEYAISRFCSSKDFGQVLVKSVPGSISNLANMAEESAPPAFAERGPIRVGKVAHLNDMALWRSVAAHYIAAFSSDFRLYPFIVAA